MALLQTKLLSAESYVILMETWSTKDNVLAFLRLMSLQYIGVFMAGQMLLTEKTKGEKFSQKKTKFNLTLFEDE